MRFPSVASVAFFLIVFPMAASAAQEEPVRAVVAKDSVNLRSAPDVHSRSARMRLSKGDIVIVRRSSDPDWFEIQLPPPFKGFFVRKDMLTVNGATAGKP